MKTEISLAGVSQADRLKCAQEAAEDVLAQLRVRFPEAEGYRYSAVEDKPPDGSGFRRYVRVRRRVNFGVNVAIDATDRVLSGLKVSVIPESLLTIIVSIGGFLAGYALISGLVIGYNHTTMFTDSGRGAKLTDDGQMICVGLVFIGVPLAAILAWALFILTSPLQELNSAATKELMRALTECVTRKTKEIVKG